MLETGHQGPHGEPVSFSRAGKTPEGGSIVAELPPALTAPTGKIPEDQVLDIEPGFVFPLTKMSIQEAMRILHETGELPFGFVHDEHGLRPLMTNQPPSFFEE